MFTRSTLITLLLANVGYSCLHATHSSGSPSLEERLDIARMNIARRAARNIPTSKKTAIENVRVFDGEKLLPLGTVYLDGDTIVSYAEGAEVVDGNGGTLLSGLIDAHAHPVSVDDLEALTSYGVTTTIVTSCYPNAICDSLKNHTGLTDIRIAGLSANSANSTHALVLGLLPNQTLSSPSQAPQFVADQIAVGATFIKIIAEMPNSTTLDQATMNALVVAAHANNIRAVCHAADYAAMDRALTAQVDQAHHVPTDVPLDSALSDRFVAQKTVSIPTLSIFRQFILDGLFPASAAPVTDASVAQLYKASVPILTGTDANNLPNMSLPFGVSLHGEFELLVGAGMSTVDVLRSATVLAAYHNSLFDRGVVAPGMRADLLLISSDPVANISATRNIQRVWVAGIEYEGVATS
ncbi:hydrolase [Mycena galopus ATCC 62051]|nr:hydrolase [Mycena galopus ATCC 62051]